MSQAAQAAEKQPGKTRIRRILLEERRGKVREKHGTRMKIQIVLPDGSRLGPGKIALLEYIDAEGSLGRAAKRMNMSYRHAWLYMHQINEAFSDLAVLTPEGGHGGRPAQLSEFGRNLIKQYRELEEETRSAATNRLEWLDRHKSSTSLED